MRKWLILMAILILGLGWRSAEAADQTFTIDLEVRQAITFLVNRGSLNFGIVEQGAQTLTVNADNGPHTAGVGAASAYFTVSGDATSTATVSVAIATALGTPNPPTLTAFPTTLDFVAGAGSADLWVGGQLVLNGTETGIYSGQGTVTVLYQ